MSSEIEEKLLAEVREKQDLVIALSKEKHNLTHELQKKLKEIKKERVRLRKQMQGQSNVFAQSELSSNPSIAK